MKRHKHSLSNYKLLTGDMGKLIPVGCMEALPGDTFQGSTSLLLRMSPLLAPVMHPISVRIHHWFVPNRIIYSGWEDFITGGPDGTGSTVPYPTNAGILTPTSGSLLDYLGVPLRAHPAGTLSMLPIYAYNKIFNEFYRDEDLTSESAEENTGLQEIAWEKDYFTSARPWSQKGPAITVPIGDSAPIHHNAPGGADVSVYSDVAAAQRKLGSGALYVINDGAAGDVANQLYADLSGASAADINEFRRAFALQRYQEARAQYGSRYTEYLRYLGIKSSDARLNRPEYLGGGKQVVAFSEVLRTGESTGSTGPIGELKGHGIAALRSNRFRYFCEEHGQIFSLLSVRPRTMYQDGIHKMWSRRTKEDYYQKELELIGQQEIKNSEIYSKGDASDIVTFGYQDRYSEYRHQPSHVAGEFRDLLNYWHLGRKFTDTPTLNNDFVSCDPGKRIFAEQTQHSMWIMASNSIQARRMVTKKTIGKII